MTVRDRQLREAMDLLQEAKMIVVKAWAYSSDEHITKLRDLGVKITAFQQRWSKSRKQPQ